MHRAKQQEGTLKQGPALHKGVIYHLQTAEQKQYYFRLKGWLMFWGWLFQRVELFLYLAGV